MVCLQEKEKYTQRTEKTMKLEKYIKKEIAKGTREFHIGIWPDMEVDDNAPHRITFTIGGEE